MALVTVADHQNRINEFFWYIEHRFGMRVGDKNQDGSTSVSPFLDEIIRTIAYTVASDEATGYADWKTLTWSYITYRNTRLNLSGGPGV